MTSPHLADLIKNVDPVDALRLLVADLQALADRLGLKAQSRSLQKTLKATQERVLGPRTVVMLLGERAPLKRRFLERLLGPDLAAVPQPAAGCLRLEHGAEAECTVTMPQGLTAMLPLAQLSDFLARRGVEMPQQQLQTIRLPNPTLARGLAVIDTPPLGNGESAECLFPAAEQSDAWIFVLDTDHSLSESSLQLLRALPESASRLDMVVEGAESLSGEARLAARERLVTTLRERCNIPEPRLTLLASPSAEGEEGSFWQGRFTTFQSVMMLRGRERWLEATRAMVAEALADVSAEIDFELKDANLGLRQARLRLAQKDLHGLRSRFAGLARLDSERPRETPPALISAVLWPETKDMPAMRAPQPGQGTPMMPGEVPRATPGTIPAAIPGAIPGATPRSISDAHPDTHSDVHPNPIPDAEAAAMLTEEATPLVEQAGILPTAPGTATYVGFREERSPALPPKRGVSVKLSGSLARLLKPGAADARESAVTLPWRVAGFALVAAFAWLVLWAVWPRSRVPLREAADQWTYDRQASPAQTGNGVAASDGSENGAGNGQAATGAASLPAPASASAGPDATSSETFAANPANSAANGSTAGASAATRAQLPHTRTSATSSSRARKRRHRFLGLDRLWHWIRRENNPHSNSSER